jgi:hypothetical protein
MFTLDKTCETLQPAAHRPQILTTGRVASTWNDNVFFADAAKINCLPLPPIMYLTIQLDFCIQKCTTWNSQRTVTVFKYFSHCTEPRKGKFLVYGRALREYCNV